MRKIAFGLVGLVVVLVAAAIAVPLVVDVNDYKDEIVAQVKQQTGRDLVIGGPLKLSVFPSPVLTAEGVRLANSTGSSESDMVQVRALRVSVAMLPLIAGNIDVTQITLVGARIVLETQADGRGNWEFSPIAGRPIATPPSVPHSEAQRKDGRQLAVRDLTIDDSTLIWRDSTSRATIQFDKISARVRADSLSGPFDARAKFESRGIPFDAELRAGDLAGRDQPAYLLLKSQGGQIRFDGVVSSLQTAPEVRGSLKGEGDSLAAFVNAVAAVSGQSVRALPPAFAQKFQLDAAIVGDTGRVAANGAKLALGADSGEGDVAVQIGAPMRVDLKFAFAKLDFDQLLASRDTGKPSAAVAEPKPPTSAERQTPPTLPKDFEGSVDLSVGTIVYQGRTAQQVAVKADLSKGVLTLHNLGGQFPGNTLIKAAGKVDTSKPQPTGGGKVEVRSARLRDFLTWLDVDVAKVPADRLNALDFSGQISATADGAIQIANAIALVDSTTARGSLTLRTAPRFGIIADLDIDTLNVDAYLTKKEDGAGARAEAKPMATAPIIDATVKARIARLTYAGNQIEGVNVDVASTGDKLTFRQSRVANLAGANVAWSGTVLDYDGNPAVDLTLDLQTQDVDRLLRLAGVASPSKQRIGAVTASGRIGGKPNDLTFNNFAVNALGSNIRLTGRFTGGAQGPTYNFSRLELRTDDAERLLATLGLGSPLDDRKLGALTASGAAQGNSNQATIDLDVAAQGANFDLKGSISNLRTSPIFAMDVGLSHPDFQRFMRLLQPGYGGGAGVGAVKLTARIDGDPERELRITNLRGNLGQAPITGAVTANLAGPVPDIAVTLETGVLEIDRILPVGQRAEIGPGLRAYPPNVVPASGGVQLAQATGRAGRFASTPIDVSALRSVNARISLRSQALSMSPWRVENAVGQIDLRGGVLNVSQLSGRAFDGDFSLTGVLNAARLPAALNASVKANQIDMGRLSRALSQKDRFDGRMNVTLDLASNGSSEADLISRLNGQGALGGRLRLNTTFAETAGGLLAGQAAKQLDKLLGNLTGAKGGVAGGGDINAAINVVLQRFANRDGDASGTLAIRNGVVTSNDLRVTGNRARADTRMTANLPAWTLDATTNVLLDENPQQPYLIVVNKGKLDDPNLSISRGNVRAQEEPTGQQPTTQQQPGQIQQSPPQQPSKDKKPSFKNLLKKF